MVDLTNVQNLTGVLQVLCGGDDHQVQKVEKTLNPFLNNVNCVLPLMQILCGGSDDAVRQQAGVLLKKKIGYFASRFTSQQQSSLKTQLVERLLAETTTAVANTIVGIIAATTVSLQWPELAQLLKQLINSPNEQHRVLAFTLLSEVSAVAYSGFPFPTKIICEVLLAGCQDSGDAIAKAALNAITRCITALQHSKDLTALSPVFPPFLRLLHRCIANGEDELVVSGFESIQEIILFQRPLINEHIETTARFALQILVDTDVEHDQSIKEAATRTLVYLIERTGQQFIKKKLVKPTLSMLMGRIAHETGCVLQDPLSRKTRKHEQEGVEPFANATLESCQAVIDKMAKGITAKSLTDIVFAMSEEAISSADIGKRKAGCFLLGTVIEGLRDCARERIDELLQLLVRGLDDSDLHVREAAAFALGQFAEHAYPEVYLYHHVFVPAGIKGLSDEGLIVQVHSCYALEHFCQELKTITIKPYLSSLVSHVGQLAQSNIPSIQEVAVRGLAALATAAEEEFLPYVDETMVLLEPLLVLSDDREEIWSAAIVCVGHIAIGVGKELFKPAYYELGMKAVMDGLKLGSRKLVDGCLTHVANMAKLMGKDFEPKMKDLMPYIFEVFEEKEFEDEHENDEDAMEEDNDEANNVEDIIHRKIAAVTAIGSLAAHTKSCFLPYLDQARNIFTHSDGGALFSVNADIRSKTASVLHQFIEVRCDVANIHTPAPCERLELPEVVKELAALVLMHCFHIVDHDDEKKVVSAAILAIGSVFKRLGVAVFELLVREVYDPKRKVCSTVITEKILTYLDERGNCQTVNRFDDGEGDEEEDNHIDLLMASLGDMIGTLAKVSGPDFVPYFNKFHPKLLKLTKPSRSQPDRDMAICCYADVFEALGSASLNYSDSVLPVLQSVLKQREGLETARRNAASCLGVLIEVAGEALVPRYLQFLRWLRPVCVRNETDEEEEDVGGADVDNALGAVARMILVASDAVPLNQVLPEMFAALPLREDFDECHAVFKAFLHLVEKNDPVILGMVEKLVPLLIESFGPDSEVPDEARNVAGHILAILAANPSCMNTVHISLLSISDQEHLKSLQSGLYAHGMFWTGKLDF
eukprot:gene2288-2431_t